VNQKGKIVLMGSGELSPTMVEVHKALIRPYGKDGRVVFLNTPAGFQLNVDRIARQAVDYFRTHIQHPLRIASFKSLEEMSNPGFYASLRQLQKADIIFVGPGSPTYALRQWRPSPIPEVMTRRLMSGGCLVAASAAALAVGRFTLPVYEIYKVGQRAHWNEGLDILATYGLKLAVMPHWNNSEGGHHDTRYCFMGDQRLAELEAQLPEDVAILGVDEHTAVIIDAQSQSVTIKGRGTATLKYREHSRVLNQDKVYSLDLFRQHDGAIPETRPGVPATAAPPASDRQDPAHGAAIVKQMQALADDIILGRELRNPTDRIRDLLECERRIWHGSLGDDARKYQAGAREILRTVLTAVGDSLSTSRDEGLAPLVAALLDLRETYRRQQDFQAADALRDCLQRAKVVVTDTADGARWHTL
jgi:peptidase E